MAGKIERGVIRLELVFEMDRLLLLRNPGDVLLVEISRIEKLGVLKISLGLADEMVDFYSGHAGDLVFDHLHSARFDRELAFTVHGEHAAAALDPDLARGLRHAQHRVVIAAQREITNSPDTLANSHVEVAFGFELDLESVLLRGFAIGGNQRELDRLGGLQDVFIHFARALPLRSRLALLGRVVVAVLIVIRIMPARFIGGFLFLLFFRWLLGEKKNIERLGDLLRLRFRAGIDHEDLLGIAFLVAHDHAGDGFDFEKAGNVGDEGFLLEGVLERCAPLGSGHLLVEREFYEILALG